MNKKNCLTLALAILLSSCTLSLYAGVQEFFNRQQGSEYKNILNSRKFENFYGLINAHLDSDGDILLDIPPSLFKRDLLLSSSILRTSDGNWGITSFVSSDYKALFFDKEGDNIVLKERTNNRFLNNIAPNAQPAIDRSSICPIIASFPILGVSPSGAYLINASKFLQNPGISTTDKFGAASMNGNVSLILRKKPGLSYIQNISCNKEELNIYKLDTYSRTQKFLGLNMPTAAKTISLESRLTLSLLPEQTMPARIADPRIGLQLVKQNSLVDEGHKPIYYAQKWDSRGQKQIVFYIDSLFPSKMKEAIKTGLLEWNKAFAAIGRDNFICVKDYPKKNFDENLITNSCVKFEPSQEKQVRLYQYVDPRSAQIISARIIIPMNVLRSIDYDLYFLLSSKVKSLRKGNEDNPWVYKALQSKISRVCGEALGLKPNLAASFAMNADSLSSPSYTHKYGISASITDYLPYNYMAKDSSCVLIQTKLGAYDYWVIKWLYHIFPYYSTPKYEKQILDDIIKEGEKNPLCLYVPSDGYSVDPRAISYDLGNNPEKALKALRESAGISIANVGKWPYDPYYKFRENQIDPMVYYLIYPCMDYLKYLGGLYYRGTPLGKEPCYKFIPKDRQREFLRFMLKYCSNLGWLDNREAYKDILSVRSRQGYFEAMLLPTIISQLKHIYLPADLGDKQSYTEIEAVEDILSFIKEDILDKNVNNTASLSLQNSLINFLILNSGIKQSLKAPVSVKGHFIQKPNNSAALYNKLLELKNIYKKKLASCKDKTLREQYKYFLFSINKALSIK